MNPCSRNLPEDYAILQDHNNGGEAMACEKLELLKYNDDLVQLEEEEKADDKGEDDNDEDEDEEDGRDLTNLTWLTELRNQTMGFVNIHLDEETKKDNELTTVAIEQISCQHSSHIRQVNNNGIPLNSHTNISGQQNQRVILQIPLQKPDEPRATKIITQPKRPSPAERYEMFLNKIKRDLEAYAESATNYQSDIVEKPPFNYSHIIGMAILENGRRVTLQQICSWIERKFAFFRVRKKWNNSIRHNLSLHPCFRKIGRNKEDKGKGGYWELGVDPKKCDRKRIRNRKSTTQSNKMQKKQAHFMKTSKRRQQNLTSNKKLNFKHCNGYAKNFTFHHECEELMLDEMDVQQNIDVTSTNTINHSNTSSSSCYQTRKRKRQNIQKEEEGDMLTNFINNNDDQMHLQESADFQEFNKTCSLTTDDICSESEQPLDQTGQQYQQQYKLGTIIISSANAGADMPNIQNINQRTINSFLTTNSTNQIPTEEPICTKSIFRHSEVENVPQNDNVIISSYISNLVDGLSTCSYASKSSHCHNFTSSSNSITLDFSAFPAQAIQQKPNVVVEQLIQQPYMSYSALESSSDRLSTTTPSSLNSSTATMCTTEPQGEDFTNGLVNEHFRPYIDGIDEAFQYLRSIDNTRNEDILDNLLDISVSDY